MKKETYLRIDQPGVYLFRDPVHLLLELNQELLVSLSSPEKGTTGIAMWKPTQSIRDLSSMLETLVTKLEGTLAIAQSALEAKIVGDSDGPNESTRIVRRWLEAHKIPLKAVDVGRNVSRLLRVQCGDGKIGVSYSESVSPTDSALLMPGTAQDRAGAQAQEFRALVLGGSATTRQLAKAALEEIEGIHCLAPAVPETVLQDMQGPYPDVVLVVDDGMPTNTLRGWLKRWRAARPKGHLLAVDPGKAMKKQHATALPTLDSQTLGQFKAAIRQALTPDETPAAGRVLRFPKKARTAKKKTAKAKPTKKKR